MCGQIVIAVSYQDICEHYGVSVGAIDVAIPGKTGSVKFPSSQVPIIYNGCSGKELAYAKWQYCVPGINKPLINARSETVFVKQAFRDNFIKNKCLIPVTGYYEWKIIDGQKSKEKYFVRVVGCDFFSLAGFFYSEHNLIGEDKYFVILTTSSVGSIAQLHHRMPVIIPHEKESEWLNASGGDSGKVLADVLATCKKISYLVEKH